MSKQSLHPKIELEMSKRYKLSHLADIEPTPCPCGFASRAFMDDDNTIASVHLVEIKKDSKTHYHKKMTEIYLVLEGEGHIELDGESIPVKPLTTVMIKPGCRHRAVGNMKIINVPIPKFDPDDEWLD